MINSLIKKEQSIDLIISHELLQITHTCNDLRNMNMDHPSKSSSIDFGDIVSNSKTKDDLVSILDDTIKKKGMTWIKDHLESCLVNLDKDKEHCCRVLLFKSLFPIINEFDHLSVTNEQMKQMNDSINTIFMTSIQYQEQIKEEIRQCFTKYYPQICPCMLEKQKCLYKLLESRNTQSFVINLFLFPLGTVIENQHDNISKLEILQIWKNNYCLLMKYFDKFLPNVKSRLDEFWTCIHEYLLIPLLKCSVDGDTLLVNIIQSIEWIWKDLLINDILSHYWRWILYICKGFIYFIKQERDNIIIQYSHPFQEEKKLQLLSKCHHRLVLFHQEMTITLKDRVFCLISNDSSIHLESLDEILVNEYEELLNQLIHLMAPPANDETNTTFDKNDN